MDDVSSVRDSPVDDSISVTPWATRIRALSDRLVAAQRPIRVLDAVKWDDAIERAYFAAGARELPYVTRATYAARSLPFEPAAKKSEFLALERDVRRQLGSDHPAGRILLRMCREYRSVVDLLLARGTPEFGMLSRRLYGTTRKNAGLKQAAFHRPIAQNHNHDAADSETESYDAVQVMVLLTRRLSEFFGDPRVVRVRLSDGIVADAAAGCDYLKVRRNARFTPREVRVLEVHEGWVHLGTTLNGQAQPVCTFLAKGPPSSTITQEGLAVFTEFLAGAAHPGRVHRLTNRIAGVALAEEGADFRDVYRFYLDRGCEPRESYQHSMRIFRGSLPTGAGPFTKDLAYGNGLLKVSRFVREAIRDNKTDLVPLLFCGKTHLDDLPALEQLVHEGLVVPPRFLPPPFAQLKEAPEFDFGLAARN